MKAKSNKWIGEVHVVASLLAVHHPSLQTTFWAIGCTRSRFPATIIESSRTCLTLQKKGGANKCTIPIIFLRLWLSGAPFVVCVSVEVRLALGVFEGEKRSGMVHFL